MELSYDSTVVCKEDVDWLVENCNSRWAEYGNPEDRVKRLVGHMVRIRSSDWWKQYTEDREDTGPHDKTMSVRQRTAELEARGFRSLGTRAREKGIPATDYVWELLRETPNHTVSELAHRHEISNPKNLGNTLLELYKYGRIYPVSFRKCRITKATSRSWRARQKPRPRGV